MSLIEIKNLKVHYPIRSGFLNRVTDQVKAVDGINFNIEAGETYGLVGESGSGKSTTGKSVVGLENVTSGSILYEGVDITKGSARRNIKYNQNVQMIFQDSLSSLNPRKRVLDIIAEPLRNFQHLSAEDEKIRVLQLLDTVGLNPESLYKYPHQFSGGQRQRIGIARAVATNPKLIIADEPVSALDLSVQAQVLNFMKKIQREFGISYLFISHDLGVVRHMCQNIAIMNKGRLVEVGTREDIYEHPMHIYTKRLLAAIPEVDVAHRQERQQQRKEIEKIYQEQSSQYYDKDGLAYPLIQVSPTHFVALPEEKLAKG
ncbi:ABC transporter ATP-binding protein [Weissella paramesenteroides]|uniref:ABC transporter ATP-binding protein n=1 Tax=Weissella paramesenteroides TaxID=1249 RepID=UPI00123BB8A2|nr:ATP-binding cassette domain-containing protein [Weissella paramesenteroides]KAA8440324.1 ABC transporter ATP-binding protein [Weissella paramesenteroides]KAA8440604.1 ABC transporter ATP-binding protein [Weissella paramesenteroides]KAA8440699.1 ABC transporter ATP-binding protein [Weissella paramesenteroides]KAA8445687.1 ABC transporter ATP-binding protein [Weissella paramesenteroides]KAA8448503.1 ABC transporter ATP-binding protein [Weissella paramesenteroides]